jgi:hypothetical protein
MRHPTRTDGLILMVVAVTVQEELRPTTVKMLKGSECNNVESALPVSDVASGYHLNLITQTGGATLNELREVADCGYGWFYPNVLE